MRLDRRILLPAALVAGAIAIPGASPADPPPDHISCPNGNSGYVLYSIFIAPDAASKDHNGDTFVCMKTNGSGDPNYKDNNNPPVPSTNPADYDDNLIDGV
jgi:hypothetical protein